MMLSLDLEIYNASIDVHANNVEFIYVSLLVWC